MLVHFFFLFLDLFLGGFLILWLIKSIASSSVIDSGSIPPFNEALTLPSLTYGPYLPVFTVRVLPDSGCTPNDFSSEEDFLRLASNSTAFSKEISRGVSTPLRGALLFPHLI